MNQLLPPIVSKVTLATLMRFVLVSLFARWGWTFTEAQIGELASWLAWGVVFVGYLAWSRLSDRTVAAQAAVKVVENTAQAEREVVVVTPKIPVLGSIDSATGTITPNSLRP